MWLWLFTGTCVLASSFAYAEKPRNFTIMQIQGTAARSPLEGRTVSTTGIVTQCSHNHRRCWIQDAGGDGDSATSDGILVDLRGRRHALRPGDLITVTGRVRERQFGNALPRTEITRVQSVRIRSRNHDLPAATPLTKLPDRSIPQSIVYWEAREGMRVRIAAAIVVAPTTRFGEFTVVTEANARPGSGFEPSTSHLLVRPLRDGEVDYNPERVIVDDDTAAAPQVRPGDRVFDMEGVVDYAFGNYKVQQAALRVRSEAGAGAVTAPSAPGLRLASFNLENFFDTQASGDRADRTSTPSPADFEIKLAKLTLAIVEMLRLPDILAVQEAENTSVLELLAERINRLGRYDYRAVSFESSDPRGIEVGLLWDEKRVQFQQAAPMNTPMLGTSFGVGSTSPGREPLVGEFLYRGRPLTVVVNHFKSKGGDDPLFGERQPPRRPTEAQRKLQARAVRAYVDRRLRADPEALIAVAGDLNDFDFPEPGEGASHPLAILRGSQPPQLASVSDRIPAPQRYSFIYDGNSQLLDYILVSPALHASLTGARIVHFNADFPESLGRRPDTPQRVSDHDPVEASFSLH